MAEGAQAAFPFASAIGEKVTALSAAAFPSQSSTPLPYEIAATSAHRRRHGQFFTPATVAGLMADWIAACQPKSILDPAIGLGALADACLRRLPGCRIDGFDIDPLVISYLPESVRAAGRMRCADFLMSDLDRHYDAVIMNPPYIRHRELQGRDRHRRAEQSSTDCTIPRSANLYVDFVIRASIAIANGGRGAFLIPAEWMSANFSSSLKRYLADSGLLHSIITFSNGSRIFDGALTTASLLLLERGNPGNDVASYHLTDIDAEAVPTTMDAVAALAPKRLVERAVLRSAAKWEPLLRGTGFAMPDRWTTLDRLATPRRGIATGANHFFLVSNTAAAKAGLRPANLKPCVGRSREVAGLVFRAADFDDLDAADANVWLLDFKEAPDNNESTYLAAGERAGLAERFLLRNRKPWFSMEQREPSSIWAGVFARSGLRFIYNEAGARSLTNFHCLYPRREGAQFARALVATLNASRTREAMLDHQRGFGGGLCKFEPNDLKNIPVPDLRLIENDILSALGAALDLSDGCLRQRSAKSVAAIDEVLSAL